MANQYEVDPRQALFLKYYLDPKSETFSNALQSALKAGYAQEYAESLTSKMPDWLAENVGQADLLKKAERNLNNLLEQDGDLKVQADITKFVASRAGKARWSEQTEVVVTDKRILLD